jgi:deoxyribose-phosphate aldolase
MKGTIAMLQHAELARKIDHTLLRAHATQGEIALLCDEAVKNGFRSVSINPAWVSFCARRLEGTGVGVDACVGFPLGATTAHVKTEEAREAVRNGATEIDMVINIGALKSGYAPFVEKEIAAVVQAAGAAGVKVILETSCLTDEEKTAVCEMSIRAGAAFVKTSTGFAQGGATVEDVALMRGVVGGRLGIKAAGGIRCLADALALVEAGATVIGTSAGIAIIGEVPE